MQQDEFRRLLKPPVLSMSRGSLLQIVELEK